MSVGTSSTPWPLGEFADCACPHCGHVDQLAIKIARELEQFARDGKCSACHCEYMAVAKSGALVAEKLACDAQSYMIKHYYDIGDQSVTVRAPQGFDARRAAMYLQFHAEEWFGEDALVSNLGIASALVTFYGCKHAARNTSSQVIDMHDDREEWPDADTLMADQALHRDGLREFLGVHLHV